MGVPHPEAASHQREVGGDPGEHVLGVVDQVDLVHDQDHVRHPEQRGDGQMPPGLLDDAVAGIDEQHDHVGGGGARHRVPGVLHVPGAVGQDELPCRGGEVAVRDVDRDALLALGAQTVGQQSKISMIKALAPADVLDMIESVGQHGVGVEQQPSDQGGLAVVDRAGGGQPEQGTTADSASAPGRTSHR